MEECRNSAIESGYYQVNMQGASLKECWRFGGSVLGFLIALFDKVIRKKMFSFVWLPTYEAEVVCSIDDYGPLTRERLAPLVKMAKCSGYREGRFSKITKLIDDTVRESGAYVALHEDGMRVITIGFVYVLNVSGSVPVETKQTYIRTGFMTHDMQTVVALNYRHYWNDGELSRKICMPRSNLVEISERVGKELKKSDKPVVSFNDLGHMLEVSRPVEEREWLQRIKRGLIVKAEVAGDSIQR